MNEVFDNKEPRRVSYQVGGHKKNTNFPDISDIVNNNVENIQSTNPVNFIT